MDTSAGTTSTRWKPVIWEQAELQSKLHTIQCGARQWRCWEWHGWRQGKLAEVESNTFCTCGRETIRPKLQCVGVCDSNFAHLINHTHIALRLSRRQFTWRSELSPVYAWCNCYLGAALPVPYLARIHCICRIIHCVHAVLSLIIDLSACCRIWVTATLIESIRSVCLGIGAASRTHTKSDYIRLGPIWSTDLSSH